MLCGSTSGRSGRCGRCASPRTGSGAPPGAKPGRSSSGISTSDGTFARAERAMQILTELCDRPDHISFSLDGRYLTAGGSFFFHLWEPAAGPEPLWEDAGRPFAFTADGAGVISGHQAEIVRRDIRTGEETPEPALVELRPT